ncbi:MAG: hypothetical protein MUO19_03840 [Dehalococcoidales bacterium]|nr:hypothetical protein [Dehalococcoidales bacterium]
MVHCPSIDNKPGPVCKGDFACTGGGGRREVDANRALSELIVNLSHDIRTPLNIITGYTELLLEEVSGTVSDEQKENLEEIRRSSDRILEILNGYLSQVETGETR